MKVEAKIWRDVGVGILLMGQADVETDRFGSDVERTAIGGLHDSGGAAGHDNPLLPIGGLVRRAYKVTEFSGNFIILALGEDTPGNCQASSQVIVASVGRQGRLQHIHLTLCSSWFAYPRTSEDHDRVANAVLFKQQFGLEIADLQADAPHAVPREEVEVGVGPTITGAFENCLDPPGSVRIFFRGLRALPGKRLAPIHGVGRLWKPQLVRV